MTEKNERRGGAHVKRPEEASREEQRARNTAEKRRSREADAPRREPPERPRHSRPTEAAQDRNAAREEQRARLAAQKRKEAAERAAEQEEREAERAWRARVRRKKRKLLMKRLRTVAIVLLILVLLTVGGLVYLGLRVSESDTNLPNVVLNGIEVGGLTESETLAALNAAGWDEDAAVPMTVTLPFDVTYTLDRRTAGVALTADTAAAAAYRYGHSKDVYENLMRYLSSFFNTTDVALEYPLLDEAYVRAETEKAVAEFNEKVAGSSAPEVDLENAVIRCVKGAGELHVNTDAIVQGVSRALLNDERSYTYEGIEGTLTMPDYDALYTELNVEPKDAYFKDDGSFEVVDDIVGCTFDVAAAKDTWMQAGLMETVEIPLTITEPAVTGESLRSLLFRDMLGYQTTVFASSGENRINNIKLAVSKINGVVLMPGETFSYNETLGQRTKEAGFLEAGAYSSGQVVQEIGGGICQVSSTLYCATLFANLETVSRTAHYFRVDYLPIAYDATVSWPNPDFKFRNNRDYPIKIVAYTTNDSDLTVEIWGTDVDGSYVELTNETWVVTDPTYTGVITGWLARATRHVYDANGNEIATILEPYGNYNKHPEDIQWPAEYYAAQSGDATVITE